jgi:hypothetical protein
VSVIPSEHAVKFSSLIAVTTISQTLVSAAIAQDAGCLYRTQGPSIAEITYSYTTTDSTSDPLQGTGFLISSKGHVLTAAHAVSPKTGDKAVTESIKLRFGPVPARTIDAIVVRRDLDQDLALLKIPEDEQTLIPVPLGDSSSLDVGNELTGLGFPNSGLAIVPKAIITARNTIVHGVLKTFWQTALALNHGNSGGPVFGKLGTAVGISVSKIDGREQLSFVVPMQYARPLIDQAGVALVKAGSCGELPMCRIAANGVERYDVDQVIAGESGWRGGGYNQTAYCNDRRTDLASAHPSASLTEVRRGEDSHKDVWGHVTYNYYCDFHVQDNPVFNNMASLSCIPGP